MLEGNTLGGKRVKRDRRSSDGISSDRTQHDIDYFEYNSIKGKKKVFLFCEMCGATCKKRHNNSNGIWPFSTSVYSF